MALRDQKVRIAAGEQITLAVDADYLRIKKSNIPVRFKTVNGDDFEIKQGDEVSIASFQYVYIKNESAGDEVIDLYTGTKERVGSAELSGDVNVSGSVFVDGGSVSVSGNVDLSAITIAQLKSVAVSNYSENYIQYGASWASKTALAANTPQVVFSPASNVNGAVVWMAKSGWYAAGGSASCNFVAKSSNPTTDIDGDVIHGQSNMSTTDIGGMGVLANPVFIPAGKGLYLISGVAISTHNSAVLYTLK